MPPTDPTGPGTEDTATASSRDGQTVTTPPVTPSDAGRELARLAGRDLGAGGNRRYELGACIGRGGMGEVFVARDLDVGRAVALKRMRSLEPSTEAIARFLREARVQGRLEHPAIVPVHDLGVDGDGRPFFTMKRITGTPLSTLIAERADVRRLLRAFVEVCLAVELAHRSGIVHRDLKPSNVMLGELGEVYVLDWGVARVVGAAEGAATGGEPASGDAAASGGMTGAGAVLGTPAYMAPEQRGGAAEVGPAADVYALGCVLFEILAGARLLPPEADRVGVALPPIDARPSARGVEVAPELEAACVAATAEAPAARPTARALAERVQRYLDGDRDAERRRALAAEQLEIARAALAGPGDRALAMRAAGRALALDPACGEAAAIVSRLVLEPPATTPPEVLRALAARDRATTTRQGFQAARALAASAIVFALLMWRFVGGWPLVAAAFAIPMASAVHAYATSRADRPLGPVDLAYMLASNVAMLVLASRLFGTFVLVPPVAFATMSGIAVLPPVLGRYRTLWLVFSSAIAIPAVLEATGAWPETATLGSRGAQLAVLAAILAVLYAGGRYVHDLAVAHREAQARLELQAWHLRQLVPDQGRFQS